MIICRKVRKGRKEMLMGLKHQILCALCVFAARNIK
jgi:hypothetical protein